MSLGAYVKNYLPRKLSIQGRRHPLSFGRQNLHCQIETYICSMAMELLYRDETYANYLMLGSVQISDKNKIKHFFHDCIVFNSSLCLIQSNKKHSMTQKASKTFIKSLIGILPNDVNFIDIKACCLFMHLIHRLDSGEFCCTCKGYWTTLNCSHFMVGKDLMEIDVSCLYSYL